jgi:hypothetical protein
MSQDEAMQLTHAKEFGYFLNTTPIHCEWISQESWGGLWKVDTWQYFADAKAPLTYCAPDGAKYRPDRHFYLDFGSIPPPLMALPSLSRTRFLWAYIFHDSCYRFGGLWRCGAGESEFTFCEFTRGEADALLWTTIRASGGNAWQASLICQGVRLGSRWVQYPSGDSLRR